VLVFYELAVIRSREFGILTPWAWAWARLRGEQHVDLAGQAIGTSEAFGTLQVRPGAAQSEQDRVPRLERYVELLGEELDALRRESRAGFAAARGEIADVETRLRDGRRRVRRIGGGHCARRRDGKAWELWPSCSASCSELRAT
jgi:hypothetical protein